MQKKYSEEFKTDAVKLAESIGVVEAGEKLNISPKNIYAWRRKKRLSYGHLPKGVKFGETAEDAVKRLLKDISDLQEANDILKRALGFLAGR